MGDAPASSPDGPTAETLTRVLLVIYGAELGRRYDLTYSPMTIGRGNDVDIFVDQPGVSRVHATLTIDDEGVRVRDEGSRNGTFVNNTLIQETRLEDGAQLRISGTIFKFLEGENVLDSYNDELYKLSSVDGLTQLYNRRSFEEAARKELADASANNRPTALVLLDIDGMTTLNETHGTLAGDGILRQLAVLLRTRVRHIDVVARAGGDAFTILMPGLGEDESIEQAQSLATTIRREAFTARDKSIHIEVSVGRACMKGDSATLEEALESARRELNDARRIRITSAFDTD